MPSPERGIDMRRREFITLLGGAAAAWPFSARAQQIGKTTRIPRIGILWHAANAEDEEIYLSVLRKAFNDLGYIEGKNIELEHRFPAEQPDRFRTFARELVESKVDAIIAVSALGAVEAKQATSTIPIVFVIVSDPVGFRLVESLARPATEEGRQGARRQWRLSPLPGDHRREMPQSTADRGYATSREQATANFKARWDA